MINIMDYRRRDLRLTILKSLSLQPGLQANENILKAEAAAAGLNFTREGIRNEMRFLEDAAAIRITEFGSVLVATLRERGLNHLQRLIELEGVNPPSLEG